MAKIDSKVAISSGLSCASEIVVGLRDVLGDKLRCCCLVGDLALDEFCGWWSTVDLITIVDSLETWLSLTDAICALRISILTRWGWIGSSAAASPFTFNPIGAAEGHALDENRIGQNLVMLLRSVGRERMLLGPNDEYYSYLMRIIGSGDVGTVPKFEYGDSLRLYERLKNRSWSGLVHPEFRWRQFPGHSPGTIAESRLAAFITDRSTGILYLLGTCLSGSGKTHLIRWGTAMAQARGLHTIDLNQSYGRIDERNGLLSTRADSQALVERLLGIAVDDQTVVLIDESYCPKAIALLAGRCKVIVAGHNHWFDLPPGVTYEVLDLDSFSEFVQVERRRCLDITLNSWAFPFPELVRAVDQAIITPVFGDLLACLGHTAAQAMYDSDGQELSGVHQAANEWARFVGTGFYWKWLRDREVYTSYARHQDAIRADAYRHLKQIL